MKDQSVFVYSDELLTYRFGNHHPFNQFRLTLTIDLLKSANLLFNEQMIKPRKATEEELELFQDRRYIEAVKAASIGQLSENEAENYGLGTEDTPMFEGMHDASAWLVGGTLEAVDYVMSGKGNHALHLGGGLHHGFQGKASGFCIYNDCAIAIKYMQKKYNARVLYIDTDAHHGDGVQWAFYDDPNVCTLSIHETGRYLFPGTGNVSERGTGQGYGYCFNVPLDAFTEDESFIEAYKRTIYEIADYFKPDVILTQNGSDAHYYDPLTHLSCTTNIYREIPKIAHEIAHQFCDGKWIAVGGGGYDIWRVVPRAWSFIWVEMIEKSEEISGPLPQSWIQKWQKHSSLPLPSEWDDFDNIYPPIPRKKEIEEKNKKTVDQLLSFIGK